MCGIVGAAGNMYSHDFKAFKHLLMIDTWRGEDATGIAVIYDDTAITVDKDVGLPFNLFDHGGPEHDFLDSKGDIKGQDKIKALIGHNRSATVGSKDDPANAHPFLHAPVVGVHNGTLNKGNKGGLANYDKYKVDSEAVIANIKTDGVEAIKKVDGAYTFVWYNQNEDQLHFIRNWRRPLWFTRRKDRDVIFWASEKVFLDIVLSRLKIDYVEPFQLKEDTHTVLDLSQYDFKFRSVNLEEKGQVKGFIPPVFHPAVTTNGGTTGKSNGGGANRNHGVERPTMGNVTYLNGAPATTFDGYKPANTNNSNPFQNNKTPKKPADHKKLSVLIGRDVDFIVGPVSESLSKAKYFSCTPVSLTDDYEIRIFADSHKELYNSLMKTEVPWRGTVKKVVRNRIKGGRHEVYVLLDNRSLAPSSSNESGESATLPLMGFNGRFLTPDEWYSCTSNDCAWCSAQADIKRHDQIRWITDTEFVCEDCKTNPDVELYLIKK